MSARISAALCAAALAVAAMPVRAQQLAAPAILRQVSIAQNLNTRIPPEISFRDEAGNAVRLGDFYGRKPIVLSLVYFDCPALCTEVLNGELHTMKAMLIGLGKDYEAITVSFEPKDTPALARAKHDVYAGQVGSPGAAEHWHFLTGEQSSINALTQTVGFHYAYDSANRQYAHAAAIMVLTPDGRISRYFYGVQFPARDVRLGLVEASAGKIGTVADHAMLLCYQYDPETGKYGFVVMNIVRGGGILTLLALGMYMFVMFRRDRQRSVAAAVAGAPGAGSAWNPSGKKTMRTEL